MTITTIQSEDNHFMVKIDKNNNRISAIVYFSNLQYKETQKLWEENVSLFIRMLSKEMYDRTFPKGKGKLVFPFLYLDERGEEKEDYEFSYHHKGIHAKLVIPKYSLVPQNQII